MCSYVITRVWEGGATCTLRVLLVCLRVFLRVSSTCVCVLVCVCGCARAQVRVPKCDVCLCVCAMCDRPISILSSLSKLFEKNMYDNIYNYMENKLSPYLCGFRKGYSTMYCLVIMLERFKKALDKKNKFGALLTDLSKAFDCLNHELLIAKLDAYNFDKSLEVIRSYLSNRKHRTKINYTFSEWAEIFDGIPQGSILGPLLFNIYMNDIFYFCS